jgi:hypothetical protein
MIKRITTTVLALAFSLGVAAPAFADTDVNESATGGIRVDGIHMGTTSVGFHADEDMHASTTGDGKDNGKSDGQNRIEKGQTLGKQEIEKRIQSLEALSARIGQMKRLTSDQIAAIQAAIQAEISILTSLEATIGGDTSTTTVKTDVQSITKANRVYLLVMPQIQISAAADRILATAGQLGNLETKLSARIDAAASTTDVTALHTALTDMQAKIADAKTQANAAVSETTNLKPDNGDAAVKASNTAALKDARTKLEAARADIKAAYQDAQTIVKGVRGTGDANVNASVHADATANENANDK